MINGIVWLFKSIGDVFFCLVSVVPLGAVRWLFILILMLIALWIFFLPSQHPESASPSRREDLRYFALSILLLQSVIYLLF